MSIAAGVRIDAYQVIGLLGAGGMGEVYRALDTRLGREVALKVLPSTTASDPVAYGRFVREAQAVAALSHPNILAVHDVGRTDVATYAVFELLEGASLRDKLSTGPLPVRKAIDYARQVADGLAAAHAREITHRDIKPDNLFVTTDGRIKILDFGLAQATPTAGLGETVTGATAAATVTAEGTVLGTIGYMAPEQVRGQALDPRADLFALGATLYEMCTGRRAFKGETPADTLSAVLSSEPADLSLSGQSVPPALDRIIRRCLEKERSERFQSARDLSFALDALSSLSGTGPVATSPVRPSRRWWPLAATGVVTLGLGILAGTVWPGRTAEERQAPALRAEFPMASGRGTLRLRPSPDGRFLLTGELVPGATTPQTQIVMRTLATGESTVVPESQGAVLASWSPRSDGFLFFAANGQLRRAELPDLISTPIASTEVGSRAAVWLVDDTVVFVTGGSRAVKRVSARGGQVSPVLGGGPEDPPVTALVRIGTRTDVVLGLLTPGGGTRHVVSIDLESRAVTPVIAAGFEPALSLEYLLLPRPTGLFAVRFDHDRLTIEGEPQFVSEAVAMDPGTAVAAVGVSDSGVLAYRPGRQVAMQFEWLDRKGQSQGTVGGAATYSSFALSADGHRIVTRLAAQAEGAATARLQVIDVGRGITSAVSVGEGAVSDPIWSSDGTRILYRLGSSLVRQSPFGTERETVFTTATYPDHASSDGRWLAVGRPRQDGGFDLSVVAADGSGAPQTFSVAGATADEARFSPDGRLIAFQSTHSGRNEIYLARLPLTDERWQVSGEGGVQAQWAPDGRSLFYLSLAGKMMQVKLSTSAPERAERAVELFDLGIGAPSSIFEQYAVDRDRFLVLRPVKETEAAPLVVIANWRPPQLSQPATPAP